MLVRGNVLRMCVHAQFCHLVIDGMTWITIKLYIIPLRRKMYQFDHMLSDICVPRMYVQYMNN